MTAVIKKAELELFSSRNPSSLDRRRRLLLCEVKCEVEAERSCHKKEKEKKV